MTFTHGHFRVVAIASLWVTAGCTDAVSDPRGIQNGYRSGTAEEGYLSNGERGSVQITEVNWAGSVETAGDGRIYHPDDVFIEIQSKHNRPVYLTRWMLEIGTGRGTPGEYYSSGAASENSYLIPARENGGPIYPNEFVVIARKRDGAFADADYFIEDLDIPTDRFAITLLDLDGRLIEGMGSIEQDVFAGAYDLVTSRSMERVQLIFANQGGRESSWHTYRLNDFDGVLHDTLRAEIAEPFRQFTFASPGQPNSPDYSGNTSAGGDD